MSILRHLKAVYGVRLLLYSIANWLTVNYLKNVISDAGEHSDYIIAYFVVSVGLCTIAVAPRVLKVLLVCVFVDFLNSNNIGSNRNY